jgi:hypothetical protein
MMPDPSFNSGLWQKNVGDCDNYDDNPILGMKLKTNMPRKGQNALELDATKHIACTGPRPVKVVSSTKLYFSFEYQSPNTTNASYRISFNGPQSTVFTQQLPIKDTKWHSYSTIISVPNGATQLTLTVDAFENESLTPVVTRYANFHIITVPDILGSYFLVNQTPQILANPKRVNYTIVNPTEKIVNITGATTSFYLNMSEAYSSGWRLEMNNSKVRGVSNRLPKSEPDTAPSTDHYELDSFANGWYIDVNSICKEQHLCHRNADGSYDFSMKIEFAPQRWFNIGLIVSVSITAGCLLYVIRYYRKECGKRMREKHYVAHNKRGHIGGKK